MSPISKGSYFKYNNNQSNYFAIERLTYKPWDFTFLVGVSLNRINYDREDLLAFGGLVPGYNKDLSFSKDYIIKGSGSKIHSTRVGLGHVWEISKNFKNSTTVFYSSISQDRIADKAFEVSSSPNVGFRTTFQHSYTWRKFLIN